MSEATDADLLREASAEVPEYFKRTVALAIVPSILLGLGAVLDAWVAPIHSVAPALIGVLKGIGWAYYFGFTLRACGGIDRLTLLTPMLCNVLAFVAVEYGEWAMLLPLLMWLLPLIDFSCMYGEGPDGAVIGIVDTLKTAPLSWFGAMLGLLVALVMFGLVLSLPMSLYATYAHREGVWLASLSGGILVGPLVHAAVLFRARLFLAIHGDPG